MADNIPDDLALFLKSANLEGFKAHFNRTGTRCVEHLQDVDIDDLKEIGTATNFVINSILILKSLYVFSTMKLCHFQVQYYNDTGLVYVLGKFRIASYVLQCFCI